MYDIIASVLPKRLLRFNQEGCNAGEKTLNLDITIHRNIVSYLIKSKHKNFFLIFQAEKSIVFLL